MKSTPGSSVSHARALPCRVSFPAAQKHARTLVSSGQCLVQLSLSEHRAFMKSLNKRIERAILAPARVAIRRNKTACSNAVAAEVSDRAARSTDTDGNAELRPSICWRGSAFCMVAKPNGICPCALGVRQHQRRRRHSFTDAGIHFASAGLVGSWRQPTAIPSKPNVEGRADN